MALERDAHAVGREERAVGQRRRRAADDQRQARGPMHRLDLLALAGSGKEDRVDAGLLVGAHALLGLGDAAVAQGLGPADDDQRRILPRRHRGAQLAQHLLERH